MKYARRVCPQSPLYLLKFSDAVDYNVAVYLLQVDVMKKAYHTAFKEEKAAASRESTSKLENNNPEVQKKLQEKVEKCQQEVQKVRSLFSLCWFLKPASLSSVVPVSLPYVNELCCDWPTASLVK